MFKCYTKECHNQVKQDISTCASCKAKAYPRSKNMSIPEIQARVKDFAAKRVAKNTAFGGWINEAFAVVD